MPNLKELCARLDVPLIVDIEPVRQFTHYAMRPEYVTVHNAGTSGGGKNLHDYNRYSIKTSGDGIKSWHFSVGEEGAFQALPLDVNAWHAGDGNGDGNRKSIAIEIARDLGEDQLYKRAEGLTAKLCACLLVLFDLPITRLRMHQDWSGKYCPHKILEGGYWDTFVATVDSYRKKLKNEAPLPKLTPEPKRLYRLQLGAFGSLENAERYKAICVEALKAKGVISDNPAEMPFITEVEQ